MQRVLHLFVGISHILLASSQQVSASTNTVTNTINTSPFKTRRNLAKTWGQLGSPIKDDDLSAIGFSVASSSNGKIVAVGAPYAKNNSGRVSVHEFDDLTKDWKPLGNEMFGFDHDNFFGLKVALSSNGQILVVASPRANGGKGLVSVYRYDTFVKGWEKLGDNILGQLNFEESGSSIAVSDEGDIIAIGAPKPSNAPGRIRVYHYVGLDNQESEWQTIADDIVGESKNDETGFSVDIMEHKGDVYVASGAPMDLYTEGTAAVFKLNRQMRNWKQLGQRYLDGDEPGTDLGRSVSLGHDGTNVILAVGFPGPGIDENSKIKSGVQVYSIDPDEKWDYYGEMIFPKEQNDNTGYKVSISRDGQTLAIGSPDYGLSNGLVRIYYKGKGNDLFEQIGDDLIGEEHDGIGASIALSNNGKTISIGSPDGGYVSTFSIDGPSMNATRSALAIIMLTFFSIFLISAFLFAGFKAVQYYKRRGSSFRSMPRTENNTYEITNQKPRNQMTNESMSFPVHQPSAVEPHSYNDHHHHDHDDEGSEVSYDEDDDHLDDDEDYESHLRQIT